MIGPWARAFAAILLRETLRFVQQRGRFLSSLVRPLVWLFVFAAGLRAVMTVPAMAPYVASVPYEVYVLPGLAAMVQLFNGMQSSLSMVYDQEMGSMRVLLVSPRPRWFLLACKLMAGTLVSILQVLAFLALAALAGVSVPVIGFLTVLPALVLTGLLCGAAGLFLSATVRQLENFAGVMNFVIFPCFFASTALYPLSRIAEGGSWLVHVAAWNPFSHAVELVRFALYGEVAWGSLGIVLLASAAFFAAAVVAFDPARGNASKRGN